jgi:tripartite ATP-independent transporter DctM subunit
MQFLQLFLLLAPMVILMLLGVPIFIAMCLACFAFVLTFHLPSIVLAKSFVSGLKNYDFLALPFYFLAGDLMSGGGISQRMVKACQSLIGHIKGGLSHVNIAASMIFSGVSGSSVADASAIGSVMIPAMKKDGFPSAYAAAVSAASAVIGPVIPPSIPLVVYGLIAHVSIGKLFLAGATPGILMGVYLLIVSFIISRRRNYPATQRSSFRKIIATIISALPAIIMPGIILGGILTGIVTPTEAGVVAVVYSIVIGRFVYKELNLKEVPRIFGNTMVNAATILIIIATTGMFVWIIANMGLGDSLVDLFKSVSVNKWVLLSILNVFFLLWGCFLDPITAMVIVVPIILPVVQQVGIDMVHFGLVIVLNLMIGAITPPVGILLFLCSSMAEAKIETVIKEVTPFLIALILVLAICTYLPAIVMWLPNLYSG